MIYTIKYIMDGLNCCKCLEFFPMSKPNQEDATLICWQCRDNPFRS